MQQNKILTSANQPLAVQLYSLPDGSGNPIVRSTIDGLILGTSDGSETGEIALKVKLVGQSAGTSGNGLISNGPAPSAEVVTPSDSTDLVLPARGFFITDATPADVSVVDSTGATVVIADVPPGFIIPLRITRVNNSGTAATQIYALR